MTLNLSQHRRELSVAAVYLLMLALLAITRPVYFHGVSLDQTQILADAISAAPLLILGVGMTFIILARQIDISIGSQFSVCVVIAALVSKLGCPMPVTVLIVLICGAVMGAFNGILIAFVELPSIVVTLASMVLLREGLQYIRHGEQVNDLPSWYQWFGASQHGGVSIILSAAVGVWILFAVASRYLSATRSVYAVGSDHEAARLAGLRPTHITFFVFVMMGVLTGLAALLFAVQFPYADVTTGTGMELKVIAAVVVGGTAIAGGRGTLIGTLIGTFLLVTIASALQFLGIRAEWAQAVQGIIILAAVASDALTVRRANA